MSSRSAGFALLALSLTAAGGSTAGCRGKDQPGSPQKSSAAPRATSTVRTSKLDSLASDELVEGSEVAFGMPLPAHSHVLGRGSTYLSATAPGSKEEVKNYIVARALTAEVVEKGEMTKLVGVVVKQPTAAWDGNLDIELVPSGAVTRIRFIGEPHTRQPTAPRGSSSPEVDDDEGPKDGPPVGP